MKRWKAIVLALALSWMMAACGGEDTLTDPSASYPQETQEMGYTGVTESNHSSNTTDPGSTQPVSPGTLVAQSGDWILYVGGSRQWVPFTSDDTQFRSDESDAIALTTENGIATITGEKEGSASITATAGDQTITVTVTVKKEYIERGTTDGTIQGWLDYFATELEGWSEADQIEYFLSLGDYMALVLPSAQYEADLINMGQAAALIYPHTYLLNNVAALLMDAQNYEAALTWLEKAVESGEENAVIYTNIAECFYELGDYDAAFTWAGKAIQAEPGYGLAHLVMTCVHLQRGEDMLAMETLFKSMRSTYTETTSDLLRNLYRKVREVAGMSGYASADLVMDGSSGWLGQELGEMLLTEYHVELLFEAAGAGVISNGRDVPANQISLPYPADPADAVSGGDSWGRAAEAVNQEVEAMLDSVKGYTVGSAGTEERQAWCLAFLNLYYEYQIYTMQGELYGGIPYEETGKSYPDDLEYTLSQFQWDADSTLHSIIMENWRLMRAAYDRIEKELDYYDDKYKNNRIELYVCEAMMTVADQHVVEYTTRRKEMYEESMRPLLEEYWLKMNAMLGYVENETVRQNYETRMVANINREAYVNPLYHAAAYISTGDEHREMANYHRRVLEQEQQEIARRRDAQIQANKTPNGQLKDFDQGKESGYPLSDLVITIPPFSPIYVKFGMTGDNYMFSYGAFGHEIIKERNAFTGLFSETIITRSSVLPTGLGELSSLISDIKDVFDAGSGIDYLMGKLNPVGGIPSFDRTKGHGKTYTYDYDGRLIDVTTIREESVSGSLGGISLGQTVTHTASKYNREGYLSTHWNTETKTDLSFGFFSVSQ